MKTLAWWFCQERGGKRFALAARAGDRVIVVDRRRCESFAVESARTRYAPIVPARDPKALQSAMELTCPTLVRVIISLTERA